MPRKVFKLFIITGHQDVSNFLFLFFGIIHAVVKLLQLNLCIVQDDFFVIRFYK